MVRATQPQRLSRGSPSCRPAPPPPAAGGEHLCGGASWLRDGDGAEGVPARGGRGGGVLTEAVLRGAQPARRYAKRCGVKRSGAILPTERCDDRNVRSGSRKRGWRCRWLTGRRVKRSSQRIDTERRCGPRVVDWCWRGRTRGGVGRHRGHRHIGPTIWGCARCAVGAGVDRLCRNGRRTRCGAVGGVDCL